MDEILTFVARSLLAMIIISSTYTNTIVIDEPIVDVDNE